VDILLDPAVVAILAGQHQEIDPGALLLGIHARIGIDGVLDGQQNLHAGQALAVSANEGGGQGVDHEAGTDPRQTLLGLFMAQTLGLAPRDALHILTGIQTQLLAGIHGRTLLEPRQHRKHGRHLEGVRIEMDTCKRTSPGYELLVDARFFLVGQGVGHLDDHHAIQQCLVLLFLQELLELGQVGMRQHRLIKIDQWETRYLDVLFLRKRQQQIQKLALDLENFDHLQNAAACGVDRPGPRPGPRIPFIPIFGHLGKIHGSHKIRNVGRGGIMRCIGAHTHASCLGKENTLNGQAHGIAIEVMLQPTAAKGTNFSLQSHAILFPKCRPQGMRDDIQRGFMTRATRYGIDRPLIGEAVFLKPSFEQDDQTRLAAGRRPQQQQQPSRHLGTHAGCLEIGHHPLQGFIDAEQLLAEQGRGILGGMLRIDFAPLLLPCLVALPAQHVPDVLMTVSRQASRRCRKNIRQKLAQGATPLGGAVFS